MTQPTTYKTRKDSRLNMFYKIVNNKVEIQKTQTRSTKKAGTTFPH